MGDAERELFVFAEGTLADPLALPILWAILAVLLIAWGVMSAILLYHWKSYSFDQKKITRPKVAYIIGSSILACSMVVSLIFYSL